MVLSSAKTQLVYLVPFYMKCIARVGHVDLNEQEFIDECRIFAGLRIMITGSEARHDYTTMDAIHITGSQMTTPPFPPSLQHPLGTDSFGHDLFSRCVYGILPTFAYVAVADICVLVVAMLLAVWATVGGNHTARSVIDAWSALTSLVPGLILALLLLEIPAIYWAGVTFHPGLV